MIYPTTSDDDDGGCHDNVTDEDRTLDAASWRGEEGPRSPLDSLTSAVGGPEPRNTRITLEIHAHDKPIILLFLLLIIIIITAAAAAAVVVVVVIIIVITIIIRKVLVHQIREERSRIATATL